MSERDYLLTIIMPAITTLIIVGIIAYSRIQRTKAQTNGDDAYRKLAERAAVAEAETASALAAIQASLADVRGRLISIETVLKDVG